jgi:phosphatidylserine/phosphatidylglycerophosphate/cardiolipin synthase-like enzyme
MSAHTPIRFIRDDEHYGAVLEEGMLRAERSIKIATANVKEIRVRRGKRFVSILRAFEEMVERGVSIRILHGAAPSRRFRAELEASPILASNERFEMLFCPRAHLKMVLVDGRFLYVGSANFTGAGLGVKKKERRNFELGFTSSDPETIRWHESIFETIWSNALCETCDRKEYCE